MTGTYSSSEFWRFSLSGNLPDGVEEGDRTCSGAISVDSQEESRIAGETTYGEGARCPRLVVPSSGVVGPDGSVLWKDPFLGRLVDELGANMGCSVALHPDAYVGSIRGGDLHLEARAELSCADGKVGLIVTAEGT